MASKSKKRSKKLSSAQLLSQVQRNLEKDNFKQALKDAKVCYRNAASEEHRRHLEFACIGRMQQLQRQGNQEACRGVAESLLDLGANEPAVQAALPDVLLWLGLLDRLPADLLPVSDADRAAWDLRIADRAVLEPESASNARPEIQDGARRVRRALEALEQGETSDLQDHLSGIPRSSPFADWKFFVRGLAAYYQQEAEKMLSNWSRLAPGRVAARIAHPLMVVAGAARLDPSDAALQSKLASLERGVSEQSLLTPLRRIQRHLAEEDWHQVFRALAGIRCSLREFDQGLYIRLVECLCAEVVTQGWTSGLDRLIKVVEPLPLDPNWNRARALVRDFCPHLHPEESIPFWRKFITDLCTADLNQDQRDLARSLVWLRLGRIYARDADEQRNCRCGASHDDEVAEAIQQTVACLEHCIELTPTDARAFEALADLHAEADQPDRVAETYRRALGQIPDYLAGLLYLTQHYLDMDEPLEAREFALRAKRTKPLDRQMTVLVWTTLVAAARFYAGQGKFDEARGQFEEADALLPQKSEDYVLLGKRAVLEIKAGRQEDARRWIERAVETLEEPAPLWLLMTVEAGRYGLAIEERSLYEKSWAEALRRRCRGTTAGMMCKLLTAHIRTRKSHRPHIAESEQLVAYVRRCSRVKWCEQDLRDVCDFLMLVDQDELLRKFVRKGIKKFRKVAYFHASHGELEMRRGPHRCNREGARLSFETALELGQNSQDPRDQDLMERSRRSLGLLDQVSHHLIDDFGDQDEFDPDRQINEVPPEVALGVVERMCAEMGVDTDEFLAKAAARGIPLPPGFAGLTELIAAKEERE